MKFHTSTKMRNCWNKYSRYASGPIVADPGSPFRATFQCIIISPFTSFVFYRLSTGHLSLPRHKTNSTGRVTLLLSIRFCPITRRRSWAPRRSVLCMLPASAYKYNLAQKVVPFGSLGPIFTIQIPFCRTWVALQHIQEQKVPIEPFRCYVTSNIWKNSVWPRGLSVRCIELATFFFQNELEMPIRRVFFMSLQVSRTKISPPSWSVSVYNRLSRIHLDSTLISVTFVYVCVKHVM